MYHHNKRIEENMKVTLPEVTPANLPSQLRHSWEGSLEGERCRTLATWSGELDTTDAEDIGYLVAKLRRLGTLRQGPEAVRWLGRNHYKGTPLQPFCEELANLAETRDYRPPVMSIDEGCSRCWDAGEELAAGSTEYTKLADRVW